MQVIVTNFCSTKELWAAEAFTPDTYAYETSGQLEEAEARARKACEAIGRLLDFMLDTGIVTLDQAESISGMSYSKVEQVRHD